MLRFTGRTLLAGLAGSGAYVYYETYDNIDRKFELLSHAGGLMRGVLDAENAHIVGILGAKAGWLPTENRPDDHILRSRVFGKEFPNPIGLAAGFDRNAEVMEQMLGVGFGFVEVGTITPKPQPGNAKPRVFLIPEHKAIINRDGFNSLGSDAAQDSLEAFTNKAQMYPDVKPGPVGVNLGKNKNSKDPAHDYNMLVSKLAPFADYLVINMSSPNTPGLKILKNRRELEAVVKHVKLARDRMHWGPGGPPPLLIKIDPDMTDQDVADVARVLLKYHIDGLIVSNAATSRPGEVSNSALAAEAGGLSGAPLFEPSTSTLHKVYRMTGGRVPLIGCGGVCSGEDAYKKIRAGASLVQLYTAFAYDGPQLIPKIKNELAALLKQDGFKSLAEAVGADHRASTPLKRGWLW